MTTYWCYSCEARRLPRAADECAAYNHFVISEARKAEIDQAEAAGKEMKGILPMDILRWITAIGLASGSVENLVWEDYQFFLTWMNDLVKVPLV